MTCLKDFCKMIGLNEEISASVLSLDEKIKNALGDEVLLLANKLIFDNPTKEEHDAMVTKAEELGQSIGENKFRMQMILMLHCLMLLEEKYKKAGISNQIYKITVSDIKDRILQCIDVYGVIGMFCARWYWCFMNLGLQRINEGGLEFELKPSAFDYDNKGVKIVKGQPLVSIHIPENYQISKENIVRDLKEAYKYYNYTGRVGFKCQSWLLYQGFETVFVQGGRIHDFRALFELIDKVTAPEFEDCFRVFNCEKIENLDNLPNNTRLQRNMIEHLKNGGTTGEGLGVLVFDGENIIL